MIGSATLERDNDDFVKALLQSVYDCQFGPSCYSAEVSLVSGEGGSSGIKLQAILLLNASPYLRRILLQACNLSDGVEQLLLVLKDFGKLCIDNFSRLLHVGTVSDLNREEYQELSELCSLLGLNNLDLLPTSPLSSHLSDYHSPVSAECDETMNSDLTAASDCEDNASRISSHESSSSEESSDDDASSSNDGSSKGNDEILTDCSSAPETNHDVVINLSSDALPKPLEPPISHTNSADVTVDQRPAQTSEIVVKLEENLTKSKARKQESEEAMLKKKVHNDGDTRKKRQRKRVLMSDLNPSDLTCEECGKQFKVRYQLKLHQLIHSKVPPFACSICQKGFNNKYKMRVHEKGHKAGDEMNGQQIQQPQEGKKKLTAAAAAARLTVKCEKCESAFKTKTALREHLACSHPDFLQFPCQSCSKRFKSQKGLDHHSNFVCGRLENSFACTLCTTKVNSPRDLKRHMATHGPKQQWKCLHCPTVCSSRKGLKVHGKVAHLEGGEQALPYKCLQCSKAFLKQSYLEEHQNRFHSSIMQFACMFCTKRCATKQDLQRHLNSHQGKAVFQCTFCVKTFSHRANFKEHQRAHLGEKPYRCIPCNKNFGLWGVLQKHQKSHQRKGHHTQIVKAPKGRRGCISYIDYSDGKLSAGQHLFKSASEPQAQGQQPLIHHLPRIATSTLLNHQEPTQQQQQRGELTLSIQQHPQQPQAYIPSAHYVQNSRISITPLSQMQVLGEMSSYNLLSAEGSYNLGTPEHHGVSNLGSHGSYSGYSAHDDGHLQSIDSNTAYRQQQVTYHTMASYPQQSYQPSVESSCIHQPMTAAALHATSNANVGSHEELTETESIAMDIMGLFNEPASHGTETPIENI